MKKENQIKILTYNILMRPYLIKTNKSDFKSSRLPKLINSIKNHDIVCFQESFDNFTHRKHSLIKLASKIGFKYTALPKPPNFTSPYLVDSGLIILSKFPIIDSKLNNKKFRIFARHYG